MPSPMAPQDIFDRLRSIERQLQALQTTSPLNNAAMSGRLRMHSGGTILVEDGRIDVVGGEGIKVHDLGGFTLEDQDGTPVTYIGGLTGGQMRPDGTPQPAFVQYRDDGTVAISVYDPVPGDAYQQFVAIWDRSGNWVLTDDTNSGQGIGRPWLPVPFYRARYTDWPASTSGTFETVWRTVVNKQHPKFFIGVAHTSDASGTTGEVRVLVDGVQLDATASVGFIVGSTLFGSDPIAGDHMEAVTVEVQARRTAGTGGIRCEPYTAAGTESGAA